MTRPPGQFSFLLKLALKAQEASCHEAGQEPDPRAANVIREFHTAVEQTYDLNVLAQFLAPQNRKLFVPDILVPVFSNLVKLRPESVGLKLLLAHGLYFAGQDEDAFDIVSQLRVTAPYDLDIMHAELWFSFTADDETRSHLCEELLRIYPSDPFGQEIASNLSQGKRSEVYDMEHLYDRALNEILLARA